MARYPSNTYCLGGIGILLVLALGDQLASGQYLPSPRFPGPVAIPRPQRSLFGPGPPIGWSSGGGHGWSSSPSFEFSHLPPSSSPHVTKDELLALLAAWKDVARPTTPAPAPEPEDEPEPVTTAAPPPPEDEPEPEPEPEAPAPEAPAGPPPGVPVTVSLPALVPIQLAAMWQQPGPGAAPGGLGNLGLAGLGLGGGVALNNLGGAATGAAAAAGGGGGAATGAAATAGRTQARARIGGRAQSIRFPVANPRSFASGNYVAPRPRYYRDTEPMRFNVMASAPYQQGPVQLASAYWQ
ncbi:ESX-1 secretion-associated protein EspK [Drosophila kikkawai]|uniref:ESX-1 secretion-associated protein EspK n=1 Tax=Drosophila kikkawai TaxID=30033 RepID=A0A6P4I5U1_DROKI|nr:vegetative cell wall protein gp1 [Drosophila kikkawai]KAH8303213.1 hypothetical protein KR059_003678 [Drosophila kikkawai]